MSTEVRRIRLRAGLRELTPGGEIEPLFEEYVLGEDYDAAQKRIAELEGALRLAQYAMRAPLDAWKGEVERKALDAARAAFLKATEGVK